MENNTKQPYQPQKGAKAKFTAAISTLLAGAIIVGGVQVAKLSKKKNLVTTSTTISDITENTENNLELSSNFDINNKEAVRKRAEEIYNRSEKKISVSIIEDMIYLFNDKLSSVTYPVDKKDITYDKLNDKQKLYAFKYVQNLITKYAYGLLNDNTVSNANLAADLKSGVKNVNTTKTNYKGIYGYMLESSNANNYKKPGFEIANITNKQLKNIENKNVTDFKNTESEISKANDSISSYNLPDGYSFLDLLDIMAHEPYWPKNTLSKEYKDSYANSILSNWCKKNNFDYNELLKDSSCDDKKTTEGTTYSQSDAKQAQKMAGNTVATTKKVEKGGKPITTQKVINNTTTTRIYTSEYIVPVPTTKESYTYKDADEAKQNELYK